MIHVKLQLLKLLLVWYAMGYDSMFDGNQKSYPRSGQIGMSGY